MKGMVGFSMLINQLSSVVWLVAGSLLVIWLWREIQKP